MRLLHRIAALLCALGFALPAAAATPVTLDPLLRRPQYDDLSISPDGKYLAATVSLDDRSVLAIVKRSDFSLVSKVDPGFEAYILGAYWASDTRLFVTASKRFGQNAGASRLPFTYGVDVDGGKRSVFGASVVDTLPDDPEHMLVNVCEHYEERGCWTQVRKVRKDLKGSFDDIVRAPIRDAAYATDRAGNVRFTWAVDDDDLSKLYVREPDGKDKDWTLVNDEAQSHVDMVPIGNSRDGKSAFLQVENADGTDAIERYDFASGARTVVLRDAETDPRGYVRSLDGRVLLGALFGDGRQSLRLIDPDDAEAKLVKALADAFPDETAYVSSGTRDGAYAVLTITSDREPGRYYLYERASGEVKLLNARRPWLKPKELAAMRPVTFAARDGTPLRGYLALPPGGEGKNLPLVVLAHGGPYGIRDTWTYDEDTQMLAARGYAVLRVNFRGSGGYGRRFVDLGMGQWGGAMQDDLTDATKWAIEQGVADPKRLCLYGGSYGGYAALMGAIREPDLYRCVVSVAGPTDLGIMFEWGDIHRSKYGRNYLARALGKDKAELAKRSPARRAGEIKAALMLVHGGRDYRVSPEHARAMKAALEKAGKGYEGWFPSFEAHGIAGDKDLQEFYDRLLRFLDRNIGAGAATQATAAAASPD